VVNALDVPTDTALRAHPVASLSSTVISNSWSFAHPQIYSQFALSLHKANNFFALLIAFAMVEFVETAAQR